MANDSGTQATRTRNDFATHWRALALAGASVLGGCHADADAAADEAMPGSDEGTSSDALDESGSDGEGEPGSCADEQLVGRAPLRRLSRAMVANAMRDLVGVDAEVGGLPPDEKVGPFDANVIAPVSEAAVDEYAEIAADVAAGVTEDALQEIAGGCSDPDCVPDVVAAFGQRVFRRPLAPEEVTAYAELHAVGATDGFAEGTRLVLEAMLQSPWFLYMVETRGSEALTESTYPLDAYAIATRLAFFLWGSTPSDDLLAAAADGELDDDDGVAQQAELMLADPRAEAAIAAFHLQWLALDQLADVTKSPEVIEVWDAATVASMQQETAAFVNHVMRNDDGRLATLLTAGYSLPAPELYGLYGIDAELVDDDGVATLPQERAGLLTQLSVLARHSNPDHSSPILRGLLVRENLLCQTLPSPPPGAADNPPMPEPGSTTREIFERHTEDPTCAACHVLMDPIGFGFEAFDAVGRFRTEDGSTEVDDRGTLVGTDIDGDFTGVRELAERLATSEDAEACVATQWFRYALGHSESSDTCSLAGVQQSFQASGGDIGALVVDIARSDAFRYGNWTP